MNLKRALYRAFICCALVALSSCSGVQVVSVPDSHLPPPDLPQIGTPASRTPDPTRQEAPRLRVLTSMISKAERELGQKNPKAAFQTLERALSIDGQDPIIWHLMARSKQMQGAFSQAESLARKSNTLAAGEPGLTRKNWALIADSLEKQGRVQEAEAARRQ